MYCNALGCTKSTQLWNFQFKLLHRIIATINFLYKIGMKDSALCEICQEDNETLLHLFWECKLLRTFWAEVES